MNKAYPRTFSHIGISVPDVASAVVFCTEVLGWYTIMPPTRITKDDSAIGRCVLMFLEKGGHRLRSLIYQRVIGLVLRYSSFLTKRDPKIILNTGKRVFSFLCAGS